MEQAQILDVAPPPIGKLTETTAEAFFATHKRSGEPRFAAWGSPGWFGIRALLPV